MATSPDPVPETGRVAALVPDSVRHLARGLSERWCRLTSGSANRRVFGATMVVGSMTMLMKLVSLFKESVVAALFGTGNAFDAFIIACLVPGCTAAIVSGSLNAALIPTYIEVREQENGEAAQRLYTTTLMYNFLLLLGVSLLLAVTVDLWLPLIASSFDPAKLALTKRMFYMTLPLLLISGFTTTWGALLNASDKFALVAIAPTLSPLAILLCLMLLFRNLGIYSLLGGTMLGSLAETAVLGVVLARRGHSLMPRWQGVTNAFRKVRSQYAASIGAAFMVTGMPVVDQAFASSLGPRSNSLLAYGSKLVALVMTLGAGALGTALLPHLSRMVAAKDWRGIRRFIRSSGGMVMALSLTVTFLLIVMSNFLVRLLYQHGSFTADDTAMVVKIQVFYLFRIPFATTGVLVTRALKALSANQFLLYMAFGSFTLNAVLDWLFIKRFGIAGITLSTSAYSVVVLLCLGTALFRLLDRREREDWQA
jgi:putative peptidoglycan lipid II flippase